MKILNKKIIAETNQIKIVRFEIYSPLIASKGNPGQFVMVMADSHSERIPLTLVDRDSKSQSITLIAQEAGFSTRRLARLQAGDSLFSILGPLGQPTEKKNYGKVILIGGGVGIAEIYPIAKAYKKYGNQITVIVGAKTKDLLILRKELEEISDSFYVTTDDGSAGSKGFVTDRLKELIDKENYDFVYAVGPLVMMKAVSDTSKEKEIKTAVSLSVLMVDATGMCGCCRVTVAGQTKFTCIDGPEFDAHEINWQEVIRRNNMYIDKEKHICKLDKLNKNEK